MSNVPFRNASLPVVLLLVVLLGGTLFSLGLLLYGLSPPPGEPVAGQQAHTAPSPTKQPTSVQANKPATQKPPPRFDPQIAIGYSFPPLTKVPFVATRKIGDKINPAELVIGVTVGKESRAYPINMLTGPDREIINDHLGGQPIAATW